MKTQNLMLLLLVFIGVMNTIYAQSPNPGENGDGMNRLGFIHRYENWIYPDSVLAEWKKERGGISPSKFNGVLSNPYRIDGTSLSYGVTMPNNFSGKVPVFTEGNNWPLIGPNQTSPTTYTDLGTDTGVSYQNGQLISNTIVTREGETGITIVNKTGYSYLVSSGMFPGNEQPGQVMTVVNPNGSVPMPIPPKDWWWINFNGNSFYAIPELYSSVAGLNPLDAPGWKHSSWSPRYTGGIQCRDYGTGGFAYTFGSKYGDNEDGAYANRDIIFAGFHTNEGYDPLVSGDPGYGCAFYTNGNLEAVMDITLTGSHTAQAIIVSQEANNPAPVPSAFCSGQQNTHLSCIIGVLPNETAELHYIPHEQAQQLIEQYRSQSGWKSVEHTYQSNTQANVENIPLPAVVSGTDDTTPTCFDNIQNGNETGVDCGGDCTPCDDGNDNSNNYITGKFVATSGTLLAIGQDAESIDNYRSSMNQIPAAVSGYTSINNVEGIDTEASYGTGPQHLSRLASSYPNSGLVVAVYLVDQLESFNNGSLDSEMDNLIDKLVALDKPIYLRWGYEFDGPHNHYDPNQFIIAWKKMYNRIKAKEADKNIAMVWHSGAFCGSTHNNNPISSWYPGKEYVDLMGISVFTPQDCNYRAQNTLLDFARQENKPVIIAEATPQGYDLSDNTIAPVFGNNVGVKTQKTAQQIWDEWYQPFFDYIEQNKDVIRLATYINADWDSQGFWDYPYQMGYWGDSKVQANDLISTNWKSKIDTSDWNKSSDDLFNLIGYTPNDSNPSSPTCFDNIQNGNETGIDCGGDCEPCTTGGDTDSDTDNNSCGEFGMSYINDNTARVYHKDLGYSSNIYMCVNNNCYSPTLENGYYYFDFSASTTYTFVTMNLGQTYTIKFQADYSDVAETSVVFNKESCSFTNNRNVGSSTLSSLILYPNPSNDIIQIIGDAITDKTPFMIYTIDGKRVKTGKGNSVDISTLEKGVYLLRTGTKTREHNTFIKQ